MDIFLLVALAVAVVVCAVFIIAMIRLERSAQKGKTKELVK